MIGSSNTAIAEQANTVRTPETGRKIRAVRSERKTKSFGSAGIIYTFN